MTNTPKANFIKDAYKNLPPVTRGVVTIGGIALIGFIGYKIFKAVSSSVSGEITPERGNTQEVGNWETELDQYSQSNNTKPTITLAQAKSYANTLHTAMDGYGTEEYGILPIFNRLKNNADFALLVSAYATRTLSSGRGNFFESDFKGTLTASLANELSYYWRDRINKILQAKKIKYRV
jgi:hypothetical protein